MTANEVSELTGVSVRTLHYYDAISLLRPHRHPLNGYREYTDEDLDQLQQILFFKECGFPLVKIKSLLEHPDFDWNKAFALQKKYLLHERQRIETMLDTLEKSMKTKKGKLEMSQKEKFHGFDFSSNPYEEEARQLWGDDAVEKSNAHLSSLSKEEKVNVADQTDYLFRELANICQETPDSKTAWQAMEKLYQYFNTNFGYHYTLEAFAGLGQMYVDDERFTANIDKYGQGLSRFLCEAMHFYAQNPTAYIS